MPVSDSAPTEAVGGPEGPPVLEPATVSHATLPLVATWRDCAALSDTKSLEAMKVLVSAWRLVYELENASSAPFEWPARRVLISEASCTVISRLPAEVREVRPSFINSAVLIAEAVGMLR